MILHQLSPDKCEENKRRPWNNKCSFSFATSCPDAVWIEEYYQKHRMEGEEFVAVYVGCNKGMDAVNALRMGSVDAAVDKHQWQKSFYEGSEVEKGVCGQESSAQYPLEGITSSSLLQSAAVHCLEAMPLTAAHLQATAAKFPWSDRFAITNAAISSSDGFIGFLKAAVGNEKTRMCQKQEPGCQQVPMLSLDTYMKEKQSLTPSSSKIDLLSIDIEGNDAEVILAGSSETLQRVRYLEFEYNWKAQWAKRPLQDVITSLENQGFVCYWPGVSGRIWRISGCWLDHYDLKFWSNVACVHPGRHPTVASRMEELFRETLKMGHSIQY